MHILNVNWVIIIKIIKNKYDLLGGIRMDYKTIELRMEMLKKKCKYIHIEFVKERDTRLYFIATDAQYKQRDIWYTPSTNRYFENVNGCSVLIK